MEITKWLASRTAMEVAARPTLTVSRYDRVVSMGVHRRCNGSHRISNRQRRKIMRRRTIALTTAVRADQHQASAAYKAVAAEVTPQMPTGSHRTG
jgi:hypothetical protein